MIEIEIDNQPVLDAFNRLIAAGQEPRAILDAIGKELESRVAARFETKTDPDGTSWAPWKPSTIKSYPKSGANNKLLDRYNDMLGSLSYQVDDDSVFVGFGQPYAQFHEVGNMKMERRGMLTSEPTLGTLGANDEKAVLDVLRRNFESAING